MKVIDLNDFSEEELKNFKDDGAKEEKRYNKRKPKSTLRELLSWVITFAVAFIAAILIKDYVIINASVPSGSMENTIHVGDHLIGFRLAYNFSEPARQDVIIFYPPKGEGAEGDKYIKRIIGMPGDHVVIDEAVVYINDEPLDEPYIKNEEWTNHNGYYEFDVPANSYLVLGDNRNNSSDSRLWTSSSYVNRDDIIAKASFIYFPFDRFGGLE